MGSKPLPAIRNLTHLKILYCIYNLANESTYRVAKEIGMTQSHIYRQIQRLKKEDYIFSYSSNTLFLTNKGILVLRDGLRRLDLLEQVKELEEANV